MGSSHASASGEFVEATQRVGQGVEVEEGLGRVLAAAVAGVDHGRGGVTRREYRGAGGWVAEHYGVCSQAVKGDDGVDQGLTLGYGRAPFGERDHVRSRT